VTGPGVRMQFENRRLGFAALATTVFCYGTLWSSAKLSLSYVPPLWFTAGRFAIGAAFIVAVLVVQGRFRLPPRQDIPVILSVGGLMLGAYSSIFQSALEYVHAGRASILGYTTTVFVAPVAVLLLGERLKGLRLVGLVASVAGLAALFNPVEFDWSDPVTLKGNAMLILTAMIWSAVILHLRVHRQQADTLQLAPWQLLVAFTVSSISALVLEGVPDFPIGREAAAFFAYGGIVATGLGIWGVTTTFRNLPTAVSTVGLLGVPVIALAVSVAFLGEPLTLSLCIGLVLIVGGIAAVTFARA
jgi:drug/metabolite transporter (DMT)-like permease